MCRVYVGERVASELSAESALRLRVLPLSTMRTLAAAQAANAQQSSVGYTPVALFVGGTSGIGQVISDLDVECSIVDQNLNRPQRKVLLATPKEMLT